jgi:hypothetical protein
MEQFHARAEMFAHVQGVLGGAIGVCAEVHGDQDAVDGSHGNVS